MHLFYFYLCHMKRRVEMRVRVGERSVAVVRGCCVEDRKHIAWCYLQYVQCLILSRWRRLKMSERDVSERLSCEK